MQRFLIVLMAMLWTNPFILAQSVIINEMSQGSGGGREWVELLTVDEGVDLRGWELGDNDDGVWHSIAEFSSHSELSNIARGTIIVIYNSGDVDETITAAGGEDTTFSDKTVLLGVNNTSFLTDTGPWGGTAGAFANSDGDDAPAIRNASDLIIHDLAVTHPTATVNAPGSAKVKYYTSNTTGGITDDSKWVVASSSSATPGQANGGDNSSWVDQSLPVELSRWFASSADGQVILNWTTDSEIENQGFMIERMQVRHAEPVEVWRELVSFSNDPNLQGQGSTTSQTNYTFIDKLVEVGKKYSYRLSDVDYGGNINWHPELMVRVLDTEDMDDALITTFPNPSNAGMRIVIGSESGMTPISLQVDILNLRGQIVKNLFSGTPRSNEMEFTWDGMDSHDIPISSGTYLVSVSGPKISHSKAITIIQ